MYKKKKKKKKKKKEEEEEEEENSELNHPNIILKNKFFQYS
jgi:hypothetical protein